VSDCSAGLEVGTFFVLRRCEEFRNVILSAAKDLCGCSQIIGAWETAEILRCAQDDNRSDFFLASALKVSATGENMLPLRRLQMYNENSAGLKGSTQADQGQLSAQVYV